MTNNLTFIELISKFLIKIPIIQRDYAQGRIIEQEKRDKFLNKIYEHISVPTSNMNLDFVYGRIVGNVFYPIDGQQRLTTLFLLHWYFGIGIKGEVDLSEIKILSRFSYDTRISSRDFCERLINEEIKLANVPKDADLIKMFQNYHWFRKSWKKDATIMGMLVMIQAIHKKFFDISTTENLWNKLKTEKVISFEMLDLGAKGFELTDELYIKMNARGLLLTSFENFKANFIQFIEKQYAGKCLDHPIKGKISYSGYFAYKIEKEWTDLFWAHRNDNSYLIDDHFMNYISFIAQMCFFKARPSSLLEDFTNSADQYQAIFAIEENLLFLYNSLDKLYEIANPYDGDARKNLDNFFSSFLSGNPEQGKINLFTNTSNVNLFSKCINKGLEEISNRIIFYEIIDYMLRFKIKEADYGLMSFIRITRNLMQTIRQRNETKYNPNLRINFWGNYWSLFNQIESPNSFSTIRGNLVKKNIIITENNLNYEIEKAILRLDKPALNESISKLEDIPAFGGMIHLLNPKTNSDQLVSYSNVLSQIWNAPISDTLKVQALIASGFNGIYIKNCRMGKMKYYGHKDNWNFVLSNDIDNERKHISDTLIRLIENYLLEEHALNSNLKESETSLVLKNIINSWLINNNNDRTWKYYFLKYPTFTSRSNYYVHEEDHLMRMLGSVSSNPLVAYHINPYVYAVMTLINKKDFFSGGCYHQFAGHSPLVLQNGLTMEPLADGWLITPNEYNISRNTSELFNIRLEDSIFEIKESEIYDKVEIAIRFLKTEFKNELTEVNTVEEVAFN